MEIGSLPIFVGWVNAVFIMTFLAFEDLRAINGQQPIKAKTIQHSTFAQAADNPDEEFFYFFLFTGFENTDNYEFNSKDDPENQNAIAQDPNAP